MAKKITVTRKLAIELLTDLGFKDIRKADNATMQRRLGKMKMYLDSYEGTLNGDMQTLATKCIKAGKDNITVEGKEPKAKKDKAGKDKAGKGKAGKGKAGKDQTKKTPKKKRINFICDVLKGLPKSGKTKDQIAKQANQAFVKAEGTDNEAQTLHHLNVILPAVIDLNVVVMKDDKILPA
jgi:hypothetical protein